MKISGFKRLVKEDFNTDDQPLIEKLASVFNLFQEQVYYAFNNNISITENLLAQTTTIRTRVDANGVPVNNNQIKYTLKTRPKGSLVININNVTDATLLAGAPFVVFTLQGDIITIKQITGLLPGKDYDITISFLGS
jgi:hypothetical protein